MRWSAGALAAAILFYQLLAPGFVGLADNGDFPRLAGRFSLCPKAGWDAARFRIFVPEYVERPACNWDSGVPTSEMLLAAPARAVCRGPVFDIRASAALHSIALTALVVLWPPLLLFCDLANTAYFNSFFLEGAALLGLLAVAVTARRLGSAWQVAAFTLASLLLISSKLQHAPLAFPLAVFVIWRVQWRGVFPALVFLAAAAYMAVNTPSVYRDTNLWNSVFVSLAPQSSTALEDLHLSPDYAPYVNRNAYQFPDQVTADRWIERFGREAGYGMLAGYYARHPALAWQRMLQSAAGLRHVRPDYLSNSQTVEFVQSQRVAFFSGAKAAVFQKFPMLALAIYAACGVVLFRSAHQSLAALLLAMAALEFVTSTFADSVLDYRHHALLEQLLDLWLLFTAAAVKSSGASVGRAASQWWRRPS